MPSVLLTLAMWTRRSLNTVLIPLTVVVETRYISTIKYFVLENESEPMEALQEQLAQLSPAQVAALLGASGHAQLLQPQEQPLEELRARAEAARQRGNERFRERDFAHALTEYSAYDPPC